MPRTQTIRRIALCAVSVAAACAPLAHAMERVTLQSGFTVDCARHETVGDHVRLFTGSGSDYQEFTAGQVAGIELFPDPPKPVDPAATAVFAASSAQHPGVGMDSLLVHAGAQHNIDVELLASVIHAESGYNTHAVSRTGAKGLMQLMPRTGRTYGARDLFKAEDNIAAGTAFLDELLKRYHDNLALALAAYNAGPGAVERYHGIPPFRETRAYVSRVINEFYRRKTETTTKPVSPIVTSVAVSAPASHTAQPESAAAVALISPAALTLR